jgi:LysR family transcriptional regulator, nod-box dependent transcriptional activator
MRRLAFVHERLARILSSKFSLALAPQPFAFPLMREMIQYHGARRTDGGAQWLLKQIEERAATVRLSSI